MQCWVFFVGSSNSQMWWRWKVSWKSWSLSWWETWCTQEAQWPMGYGVELRIKRSSVWIRPWPLHWVLGQGSLLPLSQGEAFTLASISYLAILVKYILAKKKRKCIKPCVACQNQDAALHWLCLEAITYTQECWLIFSWLAIFASENSILLLNELSSVE